MDYSWILTAVFQGVVVLLALKSVLIGSDFNFNYLLKHGRKYWKWYENRETYDQFLKRNP